MKKTRDLIKEIEEELNQDLLEILKNLNLAPRVAQALA